MDGASDIEELLQMLTGSDETPMADSLMNPVFGPPAMVEKQCTPPRLKTGSDRPAVPGKPSISSRRASGKDSGKEGGSWRKAKKFFILFFIL
ncbi:unnamed protein product [Arctogadus glacialis]